MSSPIESSSSAEAIAQRYQSFALTEAMDARFAQELARRERGGKNADGDALDVMGLGEVYPVIDGDRTEAPPGHASCSTGCSVANHDGGSHGNLSASAPTAKSSETRPAKLSATAPVFRPFALPPSAHSTLPPPTLSTCAICLENCRPVYHPYHATSRQPPTEDEPAYGMHIGAEVDEHVACRPCLVRYLEGKLEEDDKLRVFPIICPVHECSVEIDDETARRVLGPNNLSGWYYRQMMDSSPPLYCPNPRCSLRLVSALAAASSNPRGECPQCKEEHCASCAVPWHEGLTCTEFQSLPPDARSPADVAVLRLANEEGWQRCDRCRMLIELDVGCNHLTCSCGYEWCWGCGRAWTGYRGRCGNGSQCAALTAERQRRRGRQQIGVEDPVRLALLRLLLAAVEEDSDEEESEDDEWDFDEDYYEPRGFRRWGGGRRMGRR